jgi:hypothetical protein
MGLVLLGQNFADTGDLSGGSYNSALPLDHVKDEDIGVVAETSNALNASTIIIANLGAARHVGGVVVGPTNMSPGSTYRVRGYSDLAMTSLSYDSGIQTIAGTTIDWGNQATWLAWEDPGFWEGVPNILERADVPLYLVEIIAEASLSQAFVQYWKIEIFDTANADGRLRFGRLGIFRAYRPAINYGEDNQFVVNNPVDIRSTSIGGKETIWTLAKPRSARFGLQWVDEDELFVDLFRFGRLDSSAQFFLVPDPDDTTSFQKRSFLCRLKTAPPIVQSLAPIGTGTTVIDAIEVI